MPDPTAAVLREALDRIPRVPLATVPTPLQEAPRLSAELGGPRILVKRDDLTGLAFGGNKVRQMEYFLGAARAAGADVLIGGGSYDQSNHSRICAAAARVAGMRSVIVARPGGRHPGMQGNGLITRLLADEFRVVPELAEAPVDRLAEVALREAVFGQIADECRANGERPYVIPGTSIPLGVIGYVAAGLELADQLDAAGIRDARVVVSSAGVTQAGLEVASRALGAPFVVRGVAYLPTDGRGPSWVANLATEAARLLGLEMTFTPDEIVNDDVVAGPAYGILSPLRRAAIKLAAQTESLLLDPVYTSTGLAGLTAWIREGRIGSDETVVFVHTGGLPALFAYAVEFAHGG